MIDDRGFIDEHFRALKVKCLCLVQRWSLSMFRKIGKSHAATMDRTAFWWLMFMENIFKMWILNMGFLLIMVPYMYHVKIVMDSFGVCTAKWWKSWNVVSETQKKNRFILTDIRFRIWLEWFDIRFKLCTMLISTWCM